MERRDFRPTGWNSLSNAAQGTHNNLLHSNNGLSNIELHRVLNLSPYMIVSPAPLGITTTLSNQSAQGYASRVGVNLGLGVAVPFYLVSASENSLLTTWVYDQDNNPTNPLRYELQSGKVYFLSSSRYVVPVHDLLPSGSDTTAYLRLDGTFGGVSSTNMYTSGISNPTAEYRSRIIYGDYFCGPEPCSPLICELAEENIDPITLLPVPIPPAPVRNGEGGGEGGDREGCCGNCALMTTQRIFNFSCSTSGCTAAVYLPTLKI